MKSGIATVTLLFVLGSLDSYGGEAGTPKPVPLRARPFDLNSGYIWREQFDESMLELLESIVDSETKDDGNIILYQVFRFKAKQKGNTQIFLAHIRASMEGDDVRTQEIFDVYIK